MLDLTESNPTVAGLSYPTDEILQALALPAALRYEPHPRGLPTAREAIAAYYAASGVDIDSERIVLSTATSEAYSHAIRVLANPGDEILCPAPSYPLFDFLADINDVKLVFYRLRYDHGWQIDLGRLRTLITDRTRALIAVNPNNPTGSYLGTGDAAALASLANDHGLALIVDEVFRDYAWNSPPEEPTPSTAEIDSCLVFTLNGLSKLAALPQMKLAWTAVTGPPDLVAEALHRLEVISDTYLSVSTPIQHAAESLIRHGEALRRQILERIRHNIALLDSVLENTPLTRLRAEGGWYAVLRLPRIKSDEEWAIELLNAEGVYIHPGDFFGFERPGFLVVSLLPAPDVMRTGIERIARRVVGSC